MKKAVVFKKRSAKKRIAASAIRSFGAEEEEENDEHDEEEGPSLGRLIEARKNKNKKKSSVREDITVTKKKKRRRKGLGFGGAVPGEEDGAGEESAPAGSAYGAEALAKLRAEQVSKPKEPREPDPGATTQEVDIATAVVREPGENEDSEEAYIPLVGGGRMGDDEGAGVEGATVPMEADDDKHDNDKDGVARDWEAQIAKRAGIRVVPPPAPSATTAPSLEALRNNLRGVLEDLTNRQEDLGNTLMRREVDLAQTQADLARQKETAESSGRACSDYQRLRYNLATWVGALRELGDKVGPIQERLMEMIAARFLAAQEGWVHLQEDVCAELNEVKRLERVLGKQPAVLIAKEGDGTDLTMLDEFGRDIGSQIRRDREKRFQQRREKLFRNRKADEGNANNNEDDCKVNDELWRLLWTDDEDSVYRYSILQEALRVALDDMDESYASIEKLQEAFRPWRRDYDQEYNQCYASLSLADLSVVFAQVRFGRAPWVASVLKSHEAIAKEERLFPNALSVPRDAYDEDDQDALGAIAERSYKAAFVPFVVQLLRESPALLFLSRTMATLFGTSLLEMIKNLGSDSGLTKTICASISDAVCKFLEDSSIPLLSKPTVGDGAHADDSTSSSETNERAKEAIEFADTKIPLWWNRFFLNILKFWMPVLRVGSPDNHGRVGKAVLGFLSGHFLFQLSTLPPNKAANSLAPIWKFLCQQHKDLLESPDLLLQSAPLRAASQAYGLLPMSDA